MKESPILFNAEMVQAILSGRKTQTRRIMRDQPEVIPQDDECGVPGYWIPCHAAKMMVRNDMMKIACPLGMRGDQLWVRETFAILGNEDGCAIDWKENLVKNGGPDAARIYRASCEQRPGNYGLWSIPDDAFWKPHTDNMQYEGNWVPSIHMPRWASRIDLLITGVRVERLNDISEEDAKAEGAPTECSVIGDKHFLGFRSLWRAIYGDESWQANPWVWVIEFKLITPAGRSND